MTDRLRRSDPASLKALAIETALRNGAGAVRVVRAIDDAQTRERLRDSFARGDLATWGYSDDYASRAADPQSVLAGARSVICIAVPYATPPPREISLRGRVSNYAWSPDYHRRMRGLLGSVARALDEAAGEAVCAIACDTQPLAERALAAQSGLGWVGKHTNLIAPGLGSFVFLGEVVTMLDLAEDAPSKKSCGSCSRCVSACPTGALRGDYTIDATLCISDLTQRTDAIPRALRPLIGNWIWGCDLCQLACPPTQRATARAAQSNAPQSSEAAQPSLVALLHMTAGTFKRTYKTTAMGWRGAAVLRRNAAVALGNNLDRSSVPALLLALEKDPHRLVRGHAAWALGRIGSPSAIEGLRSRASAESDASVYEEIVKALEPYQSFAR
jgi:epoxyqueuosine reductase